MKVKEESEKVGLKLNIQKTKIMTSGPITSWQIDGETEETVADFSFFDSTITEDDDCSHKIKRDLLLEEKYDQPRQHIHSSIVQNGLVFPVAMVFPVIMYGCESWTVKKAE